MKCQPVATEFISIRPRSITAASTVSTISIPGLPIAIYRSSNSKLAMQRKYGRIRRKATWPKVAMEPIIGDQAVPSAKERARASPASPPMVQPVSRKVRRLQHQMEAPSQSTATNRILAITATCKSEVALPCLISASLAVQSKALVAAKISPSKPASHRTIGANKSHKTTTIFVAREAMSHRYRMAMALV